MRFGAHPLEDPRRAGGKGFVLALHLPVTGGAAGAAFDRGRIGIGLGARLGPLGGLLGARRLSEQPSLQRRDRVARLRAERADVGGQGLADVAEEHVDVVLVATLPDPPGEVRELLQPRPRRLSHPLRTALARPPRVDAAAQVLDPVEESLLFLCALRGRGTAGLGRRTARPLGRSHDPTLRSSHGLGGGGGGIRRRGPLDELHRAPPGDRRLDDQAVHRQGPGRSPRCPGRRRTRAARRCCPEPLTTPTLPLLIAGRWRGRARRRGGTPGAAGARPPRRGPGSRSSAARDRCRDAT